MPLKDYLKIYYLNEFRYVGKTKHHYIVQKVGKSIPTQKEIEAIPDQEAIEIDEWAYLYWNDGKPKPELIDWK